MSNWWEQPYRGGGPAKVKGFPRPLYPPDVPEESGYEPSPRGPDVVAYKRTICRLGRWGDWDPDIWDDGYWTDFAHGKPDGGRHWSGVAGVQWQQGLKATGWLGEKTFSALCYALVPNDPAFPHAGEQAMDSVAVQMINDAWEMFQGKPKRELALEHMKKRVGYTEQPANSNCDSRPDGIRTAQMKTAGGGTWLLYQPWCGCWCFYALDGGGVKGLGSWMASVASIEEYAKGADYCFKGWTTDRSRARPGDLACIGGYGQHVETVRGKLQSDGGLPTYGGNTSPGSSGSQANGGGAFARVRYPGEVRGIALVRYPGE